MVMLMDAWPPPTPGASSSSSSRSWTLVSRDPRCMVSVSVWAWGRRMHLDSFSASIDRHSQTGRFVLVVVVVVCIEFLQARFVWEA